MALTARGIAARLDHVEVAVPAIADAVPETAQRQRDLCVIDTILKLVFGTPGHLPGRAPPGRPCVGVPGDSERVPGQPRPAWQ